MFKPAWTNDNMARFGKRVIYKHRQPTGEFIYQLRMHGESKDQAIASKRRGLNIVSINWVTGKIQRIIVPYGSEVVATREHRTDEFRDDPVGFEDRIIHEMIVSSMRTR